MIPFVIIVFILIILFNIVFLITRINKFNIINKIENKKIRHLVILIPIIIAIIFCFIDLFNTIVVILHLVLFWIIFDFIFLIIKKVTKNEYKIYLSGIISVSFTLIYLLYGVFSVYNVRKTVYNINTHKNLKELKIVQITDSHLGTTFDGNGFKKYCNEINKINPDIIVITGDYVDDSTNKKDMIIATKALGKIKTKYGIYFVYGNHDKGYFNYRDFNNDELRKELTKNNITILEDESILVNDEFYIVGRQDKTETTRKKAKELTKDLDKNKYIIMLDHQPNDYKNEMNNADLVLSGHTHGGQLIPIGQVGVKFGFNDKTYGLEKRGNTNFIVSSGISDWALKFKTGTISEYVIININSNVN